MQGMSTFWNMKTPQVNIPQFNPNKKSPFFIETIHICPWPPPNLHVLMCCCHCLVFSPFSTPYHPFSTPLRKMEVRIIDIHKNIESWGIQGAHPRQNHRFPPPQEICGLLKGCLTTIYIYVYIYTYIYYMLVKALFSQSGIGQITLPLFPPI